MRKLSFYLFKLLLLVGPCSVVAQPTASPAIAVSEQRDKLIQQIKISNDTIIIEGLSRFIKAKADGIYLSIISDNALPVPEKEKAVRSLVYFMQELSEKITQQKLELYDIPGAFDSYETVLKALVHHKPFTDLVMAVGPRRSQLVAGAFTQYKEHALLEDIAAYKRVASSPEFILQFLENKPGFRYTDSLVLIAAAHDPLKFVSSYKESKPVLQEHIRSINNAYLRQVLLLAEDKNASELLPFINPLAQNRLTTDSILRSRMDVVKYFQLLVNTLDESKESKYPTLLFQKLVRSGIKEKAVYFYVHPINELHSAADATRFASVKDLRPEDLYYIITSGGEEMYTSSYLGMYKRLMEHFKNQSADSLFQIVQYDNFRTFMRLAANYNMLTDFLSNMPREKAAELLKRFITGIESDINTGLEKAMDIADSFTGLGAATDIVELIQNELQANLKRCESSKQYFGIRLYSILLQVFDLVKQRDDLNKLWSTLGNYEILKRNGLKNKNGEIIELVLFYGDEDGIASFTNFQKLFADKSKWEISKNTSWITIRSLSDEPIVIYANMPLDYKEELDLRAQDSLFLFLAQQSVEPAILVHRGHSYHLGKTLARLKPSVKLAILGSCGSYNNAISIATVNPDVQIIGSKKMGAKSINDPIIDVINETLLNKNDLVWPEVWEKLAARFSKDEFTLNLFSEYIPPGKNVSLFVLKLFNFYNRTVALAASR